MDSLESALKMAQGWSLSVNPSGWILLVFAGLGICGHAIHTNQPRRAFIGTCMLIVGLLSSVAFSLYPYVLPARTGGGLTAAAAAAEPYALTTALGWFVPGAILAAAYFVYNYRTLIPVSVSDDIDH